MHANCCADHSSCEFSHYSQASQQWTCDAKPHPGWEKAKRGSTVPAGNSNGGAESRRKRIAQTKRAAQAAVKKSKATALKAARTAAAAAKKNVAAAGKSAIKTSEKAAKNPGKTAQHATQSAKEAVQKNTVNAASSVELESPAPPQDVGGHRSAKKNAASSVEIRFAQAAQKKARGEKKRKASKK